MTESEANAYLHIREVLRVAMSKHQSLGCCWHALTEVSNELGGQTMQAGWVVYGDGDWDCPDEKPDFTADDH